MDNVGNVIQEIIRDDRKLNVLTKLAFKAVDRDNNGTIEQSELEKIMAQICMEMGAEVPSKEDVEEVMNDLDADKNKTLEIGEFKTFIKDILEGTIE